MRQLLLFFGIVLLGACKNPDDTLPNISSIRVNGEDESHFLAFAGQEMIVDIDLEDDKELKQVMLGLSAITGAHSHNQSSNPTQMFLKQLSTGLLDSTMLQKIDGQQRSVQFVLQLPDTINGGWNMTVGVLDNNGNYFNKTYTLHIHNDNIPFAVINAIHPTPDDAGTVVIEHPDSLINFRLYGNMVDHTGFDSLAFRIYRGTSTYWSQVWTFNDGTWSFDLSNVVVNDALESGTYSFETNAADTEGWSSIYRGTIKIN